MPRTTKSYQPQKALKRYFNYSNFRPGQRDIIDSILNQKDTLAILPTGGGKSLCFQVPGLCFKGTTIVISPLISLMKDQVDTLNSKGVLSTYINSSLPTTEKEARLELMKLGKYKFVYVAPERLITKSFINICRQIKISLVAVDEAHCISEWGHDFRLEYTRITEFINSLIKKPPVVALTATATTKVQQDIVDSLKLEKPNLFIGTFERTNLRFNVYKTSHRFQQELTLMKLLQKNISKPGIIYVSTRKKASYLAELIQFQLSPKQKIGFYHGGLSTEERTQIQGDFIEKKLNLIIATNAFGMGIDRSDIAWVVHYQLPASLENYYQEAGRAGRDGEMASCSLIFNPHDVTIIKKMILEKGEDRLNGPADNNSAQKLSQMIDYVFSKDCRQRQIRKYFGEDEVEKCERCDLCQDKKENLNTKEFSSRYQQLLELRAQLAKTYHLPPSQILTTNLAEQIALLQPQSHSEYGKIAGIGLGWLDKWYNTVSRALKS